MYKRQVVKKNPDVFPTFTEQYTNETVQNNSLIVECGDRSRFIGYDDIYIQEADVYSYSYNTSFDGEGAITSAIDYVAVSYTHLNRLFCMLLPFPLRHITDSFPPDAVLLPIQSLSLP